MAMNTPESIRNLPRVTRQRELLEATCLEHHVEVHDAMSHGGGIASALPQKSHAFSNKIIVPQ
jgi:hypothetical protein